MSGIHQLILDKILAELTKATITDIDVNDDTRAGAVVIGPLQGNPDPDVARISLELYCNDPDQEIRGSGTGQSPEPWDDTVDEIECGSVINWKRRFTVKTRCLMDRSREDLTNATRISSAVRSRIERTLLNLKFNGLSSGDEYVSMGVLGENIRSDSVQAGGPDAYDFHSKIRFELITTETVGAL